MVRRGSWSRAKRLTAGLLAAAGVLALPACGSSDGGGASTTAAPAAQTIAAESQPAGDAAALVADVRQPLDAFDGPSASPGPVPPDKKIAVIYPLPAPLPLRATAGVEEAAKAVGWSVTKIDGRGTPEGYVNAVEKAISQKVDGIVLVAMPVPLLQAQIEKASVAGIPTTAILPSLPEEEADPSDYGLVDVVDSNHSEQGTVLGNWVVADAPQGAKAIRLVSPEFPDLTRESDEFAKALEAGGDGYEVVDVVESPVTDILGGPQGVQRLTAALRKHPDVTHVFMLSESWSQIFLQAKKTSGRDDLVGLGSDGDVTVPLVADGEELVMIGPDTLSYGWYAVDSLIRAFNDEPAVGPYRPDSQLVDTTNAQDVDGEGITAAYDFRSAWKQLWGV
jgi:ABC-type sugar transport system substrate-binding protein